MNLSALVENFRASRGLAHKRDIAGLLQGLCVDGLPAAIALGDDCAAIADGESWLLLAIEGFMNEFVAAEPWFAGWCGVMVNVSDIYSMGGRPIAVVDALWSAGHERAAPLLAGLAAAAKTYRVPLVGGHSNARCDREQLSVAILGRAQRLLTSFDAKAGDVLLAAVDLRGAYRARFSNWDAASGTAPERLLGDLELLPSLAEDGLCRAAKDVSQAGFLGTLLMLLECSGIGADVHPEAIPIPESVPAERWLVDTFPSYGFVLAVAEPAVAEVQARFLARGLACAPIGRCETHRRLDLVSGSERACAWDLAEQALIGCGPAVSDAATDDRRRAHA